jgi:decaprenylphospho-beta-D-ribofuranose 2-oxidase
MVYLDQQLSGWGRYPTSRAFVARPERQNEAADLLNQPEWSGRGLIPRGSGLAYGDAAINAGGCVVSMKQLDRFLAFDPKAGTIRCEAGVILGDILRVSVPQGWFLAVTPGTGRATVGGCLACDVHGKNHHRVGSFSQNVLNATILTGNGEVLECGPDQNSELFYATAGGMGLAGVVLDVTLQLRPIESVYVLARNIVTRNLEDTFRQIEATDAATYSVAWLDGVSKGSLLGRGVVMLGEHAAVADLDRRHREDPLAMNAMTARSLPFGLPSGVLCRPLACAFNEMIYRKYAAAKDPTVLVDAQKYFYPLDALDNWNLLYGKRGFLEYQVVLPPAGALDAVKQMIDLLHRAGEASFFTSIKRMGVQAEGYLSFPKPGFAFSFDVANGEKVASLLADCDEITASFGGRVYLAKDARLSPEKFSVMYPRHNEWREVAARYDVSGVFASDMSRRLGLTR